jgi:hypothetical protein
MKATDLAAIALAAVLFWNPTVSAVIPAPTDTVSVAQVTKVLAGHPEEAAQLGAYYLSAADVVRRDGSGAKVIKTNSNLRTFLERSATLRFQGAFQKVPGLSEAVHGPNGALAKMLGLAAGDLDYAKAASALEAVAWACQEAAK